MAYSGTTALSTASNPPRLLVPRIGGLPASTQLSTAVGGGEDPWRMQTGAVWMYASSHPSTEVSEADFFADGLQLGMRAGDAILSISWTTLGSSAEIFWGVVNSVSTAGASLSTSGRISST